MTNGPPLDRCYRVLVDEEWVHIPACYGAAIAGPEACTCDVVGSRLEQAEAVRVSAESEIERLRDKAVARHQYVEMLFNQNRALRARVRELEGKP